MAKAFWIRLTISIILTLILFGVSRKISTRSPQTVSVEFEGVTARHTTVTESRPGETREIIVRLEGQPNPVFAGFIYYNFAGENPRRNEMTYIDNNTLSGKLPQGERGQRLFYRIELMGMERFLAAMPPIGMTGFIVKYKGRVEPIILVLHILFLFAGCLLAFMAFFSGYDLVKGSTRINSALWVSVLVFLCAFLGGIIIGPIVTYQTFGEGWGGWPIGNDITDTKTEIFILFWLVAVIIGAMRVRRSDKVTAGYVAYGYYLMFCFVVTLTAFLIPHSL